MEFDIAYELEIKLEKVKKDDKAYENLKVKDFDKFNSEKIKNNKTIRDDFNRELSYN